MMARRLRAETGTAGRGKPHSFQIEKEVHNMKLYINANRAGYTPDQIHRTMTTWNDIEEDSDGEE